VSFVDATGTIPGITGPADLTDVGAIQLIIGPGPTSGVDLQLDLLTTAADAPAELTAFSIEQPRSGACRRTAGHDAKALQLYNNARLTRGAGRSAGCLAFQPRPTAAEAVLDAR